MICLIRGGGDLASGVAIRLHRVGLKVVMMEIPRPLAVRRLVSFSEAVYAGQFTIEEVTSVLVTEVENIFEQFERGNLPIIVDPEAGLRTEINPDVLIDGRMTKNWSEMSIRDASLVIGLGPGFRAGGNCHAVIETNRGHHLGRVIWQGTAEADTGIPDPVLGKNNQRVLRAPAEGILMTSLEIGTLVERGQLIAEVAGKEVLAPFSGVIRGLLRPGMPVRAGLKIGDVDPRGDPSYCSLVSDKSLAVGGGVLEAIFSRADLRSLAWF